MGGGSKNIQQDMNKKGGKKGESTLKCEFQEATQQVFLLTDFYFLAGQNTKCVDSQNICGTFILPSVTPVSCWDSHQHATGVRTQDNKADRTRLPAGVHENNKNGIHGATGHSK